MRDLYLNRNRRLTFVRIWSAVLVQTKGWQRSFHPLMKARILIMRSRTDGNAPGGWLGVR